MAIAEPKQFNKQQLQIISDALTVKEAKHNRAANSANDQELKGIHVRKAMETRQLAMAVEQLTKE